MPYDKIFLAFFSRLINGAKKYFKKMILITLRNETHREMGLLGTFRFSR